MYNQTSECILLCVSHACYKNLALTVHVGLQTLTPTDLEVVKHPANWREGKAEDAMEGLKASVRSFVETLAKEGDCVRHVLYQGAAGFTIHDGLMFKSLLNEVTPFGHACVHKPAPCRKLCRVRALGRTFREVHGTCKAFQEALGGCSAREH
jgi:hypothetical protein